MKKSKIGLFVSNFNDESVRLFCEGAVKAASEKNINLIIFPGMHLNYDFDDMLNSPYYYQYNTIYDIASPENLDLLIIMTGNIGNTLSHEEVKKFLKQYKNIPVLSVYSMYEGCSSIKFDNFTELNHAINHLIHKHNCRKIGFVSGSELNFDATERLTAYTRTLLENDLPVNHNLIVYGNFSESCEIQVSELIKNNPDIDAICFANDEMAKGGYNVISKTSKAVGKDIAVIGFDNSHTATELYPPLTTINADSSLLGYRSVETAIEILNTGKEIHTVIPANLVIRNSCGCKSSTFDTLEYQFSKENPLHSLDIDDYMDYIFGENNYHGNNINGLFYSHYSLNCIKNLFRRMLKILLKYEKFTNKEEHENALRGIFYQISLTGAFEDIPYDIIFNVLDAIHFKIKNLYGDETGYVFSQIYREIAAHYNSNTTAQVKNSRNKDAIINAIINDVIITDESGNQAFHPVMKRMNSLGFENSYMLLFETPVHHSCGAEFTFPEELLLLFSQQKDNITYHKIPHIIKTASLFENQYISAASSRCALTVTPLFTNETLYGIMLCDAAPALYPYLNKTAVQISTAVKYQELLNNWQSMLSVEKENSKNFEKQSKYDELTGVYNRRGYFEYSQNIISNPKNYGKNAVVVFADMDNLKIVNDKFGHDDGDYSLKSIAEILIHSFRTTDIIGRIGGDEFAVFALLGNTDNTDLIQNRINHTMEKFNEQSDKPYLVNMSTGIYAFTCGPDSDISKILEHADSLLYIQKKNKIKKIFKDPET